MNENMQKLKDMAQEKMACMRECMDKTKGRIESAFEQPAAEIERKIEELKGELRARKETSKKTRERLKTEAHERKEKILAQLSHIKETAFSKIEEKKTRDIIAKAEKAQRHAQACMDMAEAAIVEAQLACLEACRARAEAEEQLSVTGVSEQAT